MHTLYLQGGIPHAKFTPPTFGKATPSLIIFYKFSLIIELNFLLKKQVIP